MVYATSLVVFKTRGVSVFASRRCWSAIPGMQTVEHAEDTASIVFFSNEKLCLSNLKTRRIVEVQSFIFSKDRFRYCAIRSSIAMIISSINARLSCVSFPEGISIPKDTINSLYWAPH